jgi:uncharacterized phiE125 gp8 family phage protein
MSSILLSGPAAEPITLAEAKTYLRIDHDDEDGEITALIAAARAQIENATRRALITQSWRVTRDCWPVDGRLVLMPAPAQALTAARIVRLDNSAQGIDVSLFTLDKAAAPAVLGFSPGTLPLSDRPLAGIEIDFSAGYGDAAEDVPAPLRQAIKLLLAHWYENRGVVAIGHETAPLPQTVAALIAPYRVLAL